MQLLVTRPKPDAGRMAEKLRNAGHEVITAPLLEVFPRKDVALDLSNVQALIATSRNALRMLAEHPKAKPARALPLFVVGPATHKLAQSLGFSAIIEGPGTAKALPALISNTLAPDKGRIIHLSGAHLAQDSTHELKALGYDASAITVYQTRPIHMLDSTVVQQFRDQQIDGVILMSPRTAAAFHACTQKYHLNNSLGTVTCFCLSAQVAAQISQLSSRALWPQTPTLNALLAHINAGAQNPKNTARKSPKP